MIVYCVLFHLATATAAKSQFTLSFSHSPSRFFFSDSGNHNNFCYTSLNPMETFTKYTYVKIICFRFIEWFVMRMNLKWDIWHCFMNSFVDFGFEFIQEFHLIYFYYVCHFFFVATTTAHTQTSIKSVVWLFVLFLLLSQWQLLMYIRYFFGVVCESINELFVVKPG